MLFIFLHRGQRTARARARRQQWKLVTVTMIIHVVLQGVDLGLVYYVYKTDQRFTEAGAKLRKYLFYHSNSLSLIPSLSPFQSRFPSCYSLLG